MYKVIKRDGKIVEFSIDKIAEAIEKAFKACSKKYHKTVIDMLALNVTSNFERKVNDDKIHVEDIQDSVEEVLSNAGYGDVAKAYIIYRKQREKIRNMNGTMLDYKEIVNSYVNLNDWRFKENADSSYSIGGLILSNSGAITANYWLTEIYDNEIARAHRSGDIHIHDLTMLTGYSAGWSLKDLLLRGIVSVENKVFAKPAKHLNVLCQQMVDFLGIMQNEWSGPQTFSSFDTYLAPFVKVDNLSYDEVKICLETFIYGVNIPTRLGKQKSFVNISFDLNVPDDMANLDCIIDGKMQNFKYKDCKDEMFIINKAFLEIMLEGDGNGRCFEYPIPTYSITKDFDWSNNEVNRLLFELASKYGLPYFGNYINGDLKPEDVRRFVCEKEYDFNKLYNNAGGYFGSGELTGSIGLVTINLPRIVYGVGSETEFFERLDYILGLSIRSLNVKREVITKLLDGGLYPYTREYLGMFKNHFSTIGIVGMNELCLNAKWLKQDLRYKESRDFVKGVLKHIRKRLIEYQLKYQILFNLETIDDEIAAYRLAKQDFEKNHDIVLSLDFDGVPHYTNGSYISVDNKKDIFESLDIQDELQVLFTSGTVFHVCLDEDLPDHNLSKLLVRKIAENYYIPYYTISPTYSICKEHGYIKGKIYECPICKQETRVMKRILDHYHQIKKR